MLLLTFLIGQCFTAFATRLPLDERAWLLLLPILPFLRGWSSLSFLAGLAWQQFWQVDSSSVGPIAWPFPWPSDSSLWPFPWPSDSSLWPIEWLSNSSLWPFPWPLDSSLWPFTWPFDSSLWPATRPTEKSSLCHAFFWFLCSADAARDPVPLLFVNTPMDRLAGTLTQYAQEFFLHWDGRWGPWFLQFAFGVKTPGGEDWPRVYEELGLLHVLVVSGAHFSFLGMLSRLLIEGPSRLAYALRLLPLPLWLGWTTITRLLLTFIITVFALVVGFNPPCQRAWLSLLFQLWLPLLGAPLDPIRQDRWIFTCQAFCFPNSFLSLSNALSWSAYSLVNHLKPWPRFWQRRLLPAVEGPLIAVNLSYFGTFSPVGIVLNTLLQPVWHLVLGSGLFFMLWPQPWIGQGLRFLLEAIHELILTVRSQGQAEGPLFWQLPGIVRGILWCAASWTFFGLWRRREDACGIESSPVT